MSFVHLNRRGLSALLLAFTLLFVSAPTDADASGFVDMSDLKSGGAFGIGVWAGTGAGLSIKIWPHFRHHITIEAGSANFINSFQASLNYHFTLALKQSATASVNFNIGAGFKFVSIYLGKPSSPYYVEYGGRVPFGIGVTFRGLPVELFAEAGPFIANAPNRGFGVYADGMLGARMYF